MIEKILSLLVPPFLHKLDRYLLLNHPRWWAGKFHYFIFYGLLANLCVAGLVLIIDFPLNQLAVFLDSWVISLSFFVEIGIFIFWLYSQSFFSVEQQYGDTKPTVAWVETALSTICIFLIFSPTIVMFVTEMYKAAYMIKTTGQNICEGPVVFEFYGDRNPNSTDGKDRDTLYKILTTLREQPTSQAVKIIGIDTAILETDEKQHTVDATDQYIPIVSEQILHVISGNAKVQGGKGKQPIFLKRGEKISALRYGEKVTLIPGDILKNIPYGETYNDEKGIVVVDGQMSIRFSYSTYIANNEGVVVKDGKEVKLLVGPAFINTYSRIWKYTSYTEKGSSFSDISYAYNICQNVQFFSNDINFYFINDIFGFSSFLLENIISIILGVFTTLMLKATSWRIVIYSYIYLFILYISTSIFKSIFFEFVILQIDFNDIIQHPSSLLSVFYYASLLSSSNLVYRQNIVNSFDRMNNIDISLVFLVTTILFILFAFIQLIVLIKTKKYKLFLFINFISLPVVLGYFVYILAWHIIAYHKKYLAMSIFDTTYYSDAPIKYILFALVIFFVCYILLSPVLKRIETYLISLPRD